MKISNNKKFSFHNRLKSFMCAIKGLKEFFLTQHNAWLEALASIIVIVLGFYLKVTQTEWALLIFAIALVLIAEILNTAIEYLTDMVSPDFNPKAGSVKDIASAAVLIASIAAGTIGVMIFSKYLL